MSSAHRLSFGRCAAWTLATAGAASVLCLVTNLVYAQSIALAGMMGSKALLVVDGSAPKLVAAGDTHQGVKVISTNSELAIVEQAGKRITLRVGEAPVSTGSSSKGLSIVLMAGSGGHYTTPGQINGRTVQFLVDTGATTIAMGVTDAERAGISYRQGQPIRMSTANGMTMGYKISLASVRIGDVEVRDVDAVVIPQSMPFLLLGNSFLARFQIRLENEQMTMVKRF